MVSKDKHPHRSSIRTRLNLLVIGTVALSTLPAAGLVAGDAIERQAQARWAMASGAAELLAGNAIDAAQTHNAKEAYAVMRAATQIPGVAYARLDLPNGQMLAEAGAGSHLPTDILLRAGGRAHAAGLAFHRVIRVVAPVQSGPNALGEVTIVQSSGDFGQDLLRALAGILIFSGCALAGSLYLARRMQNAMTCPLGELTQSMDAVRRYGDLSQRVVTHSHDEIGAVVDSYNLMLEAMARRGTEIPAAADAIEAPQPDVPAEVEVEASEPEAPEVIPAAETEMAPEVVSEVALEVVAEIVPEVVPEPVPEIAAEAVEAGDTDVLDLVDDLLARFRSEAQAKGLELVSVADPAAPRRTPAGAGQLGDVLAALLSNALKFTDTGHVRVDIACDPKPGLMRLIVGDTGAGIPRPQLKSILKTPEPDERPASTGSALRLPEARQLVESMGGALAVASDADGSQFHIRLPMAPDAPAAAPPRADGRTVGLYLTATNERDALVARFEAAGITVVDTAHDADLVLADDAARESLDVPADRLVLLVEAGDAQTWVAEGRAWAALPRPLRYGDIDALIEVLARDTAPREDAAPEVQAAEPLPATAPETALELYARQAPEALARMVAAFQARDTEALADAAETLAFLSLDIGARSVVDAAHSIEQAVRVEHRAVTIDEVALTHARLERALSMLARADEPEAEQALAS